MVPRDIRCFSFGVLLGGALVTPATAQVADREPIRLAPISVTATRNPLASFEYPGMVTVIGRSEIQARQPSTPDDLLQFVPGVEFTGGPRRTGETPSIRGFGGADVIVTIDGARQHFGSTHDGRFLHRSESARTGRSPPRARLVALRKRRHRGASSSSAPWMRAAFSTPEKRRASPPRAVFTP